MMKLSISSFAALLLLSAPAHSEPTDAAELVESREQFEVVLIDADFPGANDTSDMIIGGTDQFLDNQILIAELTLLDPIAKADLAALKSADPADQTRYQCASVDLYLVEGWHVVTGEGCEIIDPASLSDGG